MGAIEKRYCDWCGVDLKDGPSYWFGLIEETATLAMTTRLEICGSCYGLWKTYLEKQRDAVAASWLVTPSELPLLEPGK